MRHVLSQKEASVLAVILVTAVLVDSALVLVAKNEARLGLLQAA
jgi:hypothetical protein